MNLSSIHVAKAAFHQAQAISDLINLTYRGTDGWTTEAAIIEGDRTNRQEIENTLINPNGCFLIAQLPQLLASCIYVAQEKEHAYIGFFSVHPSLQQHGLGKFMLMQAEVFAYQSLGARKLVMFVISQRPELIAFYHRRGYRGTGRVEAYPSFLGIPKISGLTIEYLEKSV
ncbi:MAG: GNAT family N-acetyltransferase [Nitrosomonas sp.]|nr:GNAT family N-acetyltransferase [Nitrosomonas sp.]